MVFQRIIAGLEALHAAGISARVILPSGDDQPVEFLVEASDMPTMSLAARRLRRSMGNVAHYPVFTGDLTPERRATLRGSAWDLEAVRRHQRDQAA
ncbi:hypothetical protein [Azospirillum brasilense]|uniref:Uncharacterized protein n=1 Tax=Azospirillum brasilense TaxID=192 RepID=A0A235H9U0_AZOBR|nr:hypothetical protein [Azospirillum brasilense]OYD82579.1 hypothetical protein CHT98_20520 [Azospirillum brasilense]